MRIYIRYHAVGYTRVSDTLHTTFDRATNCIVLWLSHIWMSHVKHIYESCHTYMNASCHACMNASCHTYMNESCRTYEWHVARESDSLVQVCLFCTSFCTLRFRRLFCRGLFAPIQVSYVCLFAHLKSCHTCEWHVARESMRKRE